MTADHHGIEVCRGRYTTKWHRMAQNGKTTACGTLDADEVRYYAKTLDMAQLCQSPGCKESAQRAISDKLNKLNALPDECSITEH